MGQGYSINVSAGSAGIDVPELADLEPEKTLGAVRFMKTIRARHKDGLVVAKVFIKSYPNLNLDKVAARLFHERKVLAEVPNALAYHRILETPTNGYLARQYIHSSLYDRISTNPSLEEIEKKWIAFQLLCAVRDCHAREIYHGDIKTENMLVTTWNWLYLADFSSSFKPARLPEDNPAMFSMFFDTTGRRLCYIAPERFVTSAELKEHEIVDKMDPAALADHERWNAVTWTMDIFSVGCVIAELFTEKPTFTLSQLFKYRKGEYDPVHTTLNSIKDDQIREMVGHMIQVNPDMRYTASEYLDFYREKVFPKYFEDFLHQYMEVITDPTSGQAPVTASKKNSGGSDDRIERIYNDFGSISFSLGFAPPDRRSSDVDQSQISSGLNLFPLLIDLPNERHRAMDLSSHSGDNGALLFLNVIIASLRSTARASSRVKACELLLALAERLTDEAKLDRVLPFSIALLEDESENVRIAALRTITQLLSIVTVLSPMNVFVFPNYVLPRLQKFVQQPAFKKSAPSRATYAACLASLATTASRFLDMMQALRADGSLPSTDPEAEDDVAAYAAYQESYDSTREDLIRHFEAQTKIFLTDEDPSVRRAFLGSVTSLCVFFGDALSADLILTHLNTYLNDDDWTLKCAFFEAIVGVAAYIGGPSLEDFILPLLVQALSDPEETVTEQVIRSLSSMAKLGLFQRWTIVELVFMIVRFTLHPNLWIREAAAQFLEASTTHLSDADSWSMIMPLVRPVLKIPSAELTELSILDALKKSFPRPALDMAKTWAGKNDKGMFWKPAKQNKNFSFENAVGKALLDFYHGANETKGLSKAGKNDEDDQWLSKMRVAGMRTEDEVKLVALRDYIWKLTIRSDKEDSTPPVSRYNEIASLAALRVPLQNVLFDDDIDEAPHVRVPPSQSGKSSTKETRQGSQTSTSGPSAGSAAASARAMPKPQNVLFEPMEEPTPSVAGKPTIDQKLTANDKITVNKGKTASGDNSVFSPLSPTSTISTNGHNHLHHKGSAMNLLNNAEAAGKATAETGMDSFNAVGQLDAPSHDTNQQLVSRPTSRSGAPPLTRAPASHSYRGNDPTVLKLLDSVYTTTVSQDSDFGRRVPTSRRSLGNPHNSVPWKPQGQLVAMLGDHSGQINCIAVAPDHAFFLTGSDDGTVRVWDTARFERNVTHRSRQTHKHDAGVRVTCLAFIESTYSFISTGSDGSVQIVKVDVDDGNGMPRYGKLQVIRNWKIPSQDNRVEYAVGVEHSRCEGQSLIMILTNLSRVLAVDPHAMSIVYELHNQVQHGTPTSFAIQRRRQWLVIGTVHGVLDLWDLRFRLRLRSWTVKHPSPIYHISLHPGRRSNQKQKICVSGFTGPGHVSIWDLEKTICTELYHTAPPDSTDGMTNTPRLSARDFELLSVDDEKSTASAASTTRILNAVPLASHAEPQVAATDSPRAKRDLPAFPGAVRGFALSMHIPPDGSDPRYHYLVSGGPDWKVRFWDPSRLDANCVVSGSDAPSLKKQTESINRQGEFSSSMLGADTRVTVAKNAGETSVAPSYGKDKTPTAGSPNLSPSPSRPSAGPRMDSIASRDSSSGASPGAGGKDRERKKRDGSGGSGATAAAGGKVSRYDIIRASPHQLLRGHKDSITCVAVVERPFGMVVSGDRSGVVYLFM
ncbi:hypothetical protein AAFC00_001878 [Neodothiora populina]|uniref:non-specific serine/threonine protein kinase n=1 Tax=Neodothiora populina TaxID=2781224 RepID=A0ABR3PQG3_9PEZI